MGLVALYAGNLAVGGPLAVVPVVVFIMADEVRGRRASAEAFDRLEEVAPSMQAAEVEREIRYIVRTYGGRKVPAVERRANRIRERAGR